MAACGLELGVVGTGIWLGWGRYGASTEYGYGAVVRSMHYYEYLLIRYISKVTVSLVFWDARCAPRCRVFVGYLFGMWQTGWGLLRISSGYFGLRRGFLEVIHSPMDVGFGVDCI